MMSSGSLYVKSGRVRFHRTGLLARVVDGCPRVEVMYRVVATNPSGDGPHCDTETVVL